MSSPVNNTLAHHPGFLVAVDVGNTAVTWGRWDGAEWHVQRTPLDDRAAWQHQWHDWRLPPAATCEHPASSDNSVTVAVASVNPAASEVLLEWLTEQTATRTIRVGIDCPIPIKTQVADRRQVGIDRLLNALAAARLKPTDQPAVALDLGTAITFDCVSREGVFEGGVIAPGMSLGARALHDFTAQLPVVQPARPATPIGKDTVSNIQAGLYFGTVGLIRQTLAAIERTVGCRPWTVVTGGDAPLVEAELDFVDQFVPTLTLDGIRYTLAELAQQSGLFT